MNKESFEHIENKIKEAAENIAPAFTPEAWEAMEKMLDEDERKRRTLIFWWLPIVGLLGLSTLYYFLFTADTKKATSLHTNIQTLPTKEQKTISSSSTTSVRPSITQSILTSVNPINSHNSRRNSFKKDSKTIQIAIVEKVPNRTDTVVATQQSIAVMPTMAVTDTNLTSLSNTDLPKISLPAPIDSTVKSDSVANVKKEIPKKHTSRFYFSASVGITRGSASFIGEGKTQAAYGLGIGYQVNRKLSLQSGFYVSRKVYDADPNQYYVKPGSYLSTLQLTTINANCLVYEIPVSLRFILREKSKSLFFATAGLSTYFMKREDYNYNYLRNGSNYSYEKEFQGNQHPFSIAGFSVGYAHKLNKRLFLFAEPYIQMPLQGIGEGKVNLFSSGIWTGIIFRK